MNRNNTTTPIWEALSLTPTSVATPGESVKYSNTDITTDVNPDTAILLPVFGSQEWNDNTILYNISGQQLTVTSGGRYEIIVNASLLNTTGNDRNAPEIRLAVNGTAIGAHGSTGYMRSNNGHEESSLHLREIIEISAGDIITVTIVRSANGGATILRDVGTTNIYVEKLL